MKRVFCILSLVFAFLPVALAQTVIPNGLKPVEEAKYHADNSRLYLSGYELTSGFSLWSPK